MPRASYRNLPAGRRAAILQAAAREFGEHGYEGASLNQILANAGVSKGAAYYYFENKTDLYAETARSALALLLGVLPDPSKIPRDAFWPTIAGLYRDSMERTRAHPWAVTMARAIWRSIGDARAARAVAPVFEWARDLLARLVDRGVEVGAVRGDIPRELLVDILVQLDGAVDRRMLGQIDRLAAERIEVVGATLIDMTRRMLAPPGGDP
jgi:AcrR family transcriptional regulator